tara:strand:+ start:924 stop:1283 length:360 start_codon:yes stop_codon:yes gene_type:complete
MNFKISTRFVVLLPNIVIKFPLSRRGYLQSKNERVIWCKYKNTNLLGVLYWEIFGIVCMKKYKATLKINQKHILFIKYFIKELDIERCDLYNPENWGKENKSYYLIDYGVNHYISTLYN